MRKSARRDLCLYFIRKYRRKYMKNGKIGGVEMRLYQKAMNELYRIEKVNWSKLIFENK